MPNEKELWLTPLLLLPGVALLIQSTSTRFSQIHDEFHHLLEEKDDHAKIVSRMLVERALLFKRALFGLYSSVVLFSLGSFLGGLLHLVSQTALLLVGALTLSGIASVVYAAWQLVRESRLSMGQIDRLSEKVERQLDHAR